jgi:MFS family permease
VALMFFINYLDRTAIGFAAPNGMNKSLGLSAAQFGFASGVFFIGYILLEVPSNLALHRFGARRWLSRIMVTWGIVAVLFTFVQSYTQLVGLRFLLGVAEAGFFPGAILFLSLWVPSRYRSKVLGMFYLAQPLTTVIGAPFAGWLISHDGTFFGLEGWRFMFLGVGLPAIIVGVVAWFYLADSPAKAKWLTPAEKDWLTTELTAEDDVKTNHGAKHPSVLSVFKNGRVWVLGFIYFGFIYGLYTLAFFLPTIIGGFQEQYGVTFSYVQKGLITAIPYLPAALALFLTTRNATKHGVKTGHIVIPALVGAASIPLALLRRITDAHDGRNHRDGLRHLLGAAELLDGSDPVPDRCRGCRRDRPDQHHGQHGRFLGPVHHRLLEGLDGDYKVSMFVVGGFMLLSAILMIALSRRNRVEVAPGTEIPMGH